MKASPSCRSGARRPSGASWIDSARKGSTSGWRVSATLRRRASSGAVSSGPASAPPSLGTTWKQLGFYVCVEDLEDELIRALGAAAVEEVVEAQGDLGPFRTLQKQPAWQGRPREDQLRRFLGSGGRRKIRYARYLVEALEPGSVPRPLDLLLTRV